MPSPEPLDPESRRLAEDLRREKNWKRWGPYLAERQWATVREDYSPDGDAWGYFPFEHSASRAYRWGEDGLLGITDREGRLCFALTLWNGKDPILKERLFGLTGPEGNHGEDVKECYWYLDSTPTHSYLKGLYKYPQAEFPYAKLRAENRRRGRLDPEYELTDAGAFAGGRYWDVFAEYAKAGPDDILVKVTVANRGPEPATLHLLPALWFRNTWSWGCRHEGCWVKPRLEALGPTTLRTWHATLERFRFEAGPGPDGRAPEQLVTDNETNTGLLFGDTHPVPYVKDAFHDYVVRGRTAAVNPKRVGTKAAFYYRLEVPAGGEATLRFRLTPDAQAVPEPFGPDFDRVFADRVRETDQFYAGHVPATLGPEEKRVARQAYAGLLWSKQFYHYVMKDWLEGDPDQPPPPTRRLVGRNSDWPQLFNRDVILMPDKWEYPWYAAWDLAFHVVALARLDPQFAKEQLILFLREWYLHPNGQLPAYEWSLGDVNPPVHAWACWRVYKITGPKGGRDRLFLERAFQKLLFNFSWWVNRKDVDGNHLFAGGFLGMDNVGVFDRSQPLPTGGTLQQADGTAWMAAFCLTMLAMALELAAEDPVYEDVASKFFEHFVAIADAMNGLGGTGLWDEEDGFYYDRLQVGEAGVLTRVRSMVGLVPLFAVAVLDDAVLDRLPGFKKRMAWFLENRKDLAHHIAYFEPGGANRTGRRLLALPSRERLERALRYLLDEDEFLSPYGVRSLSRYHKRNPYICKLAGEGFRVDYAPGESPTGMFGGNSNWRGPVWFPVNYLLIEALERYHDFYGDSLLVECPTGSGRRMHLRAVAAELSARLAKLFLPGEGGVRPSQPPPAGFEGDPHWHDHVLFHEYFDGDTGRGLGASHQTGWTALVARLIEDIAPAG